MESSKYWEEGERGGREEEGERGGRSQEGLVAKVTM